jgi:hypothetical protein
MAKKYYGLQWGYVVDNEDPLALNRVKAHVPAVAEPKTTGWLTPLGWPGSGSSHHGSQYPIQREASIGIFFEQGDPYGKGGYFGSHSGLDDTSKAVGFPERLLRGNLAEDPDAQNRTATLWEDPNLAIFVDFEDPKDAASSPKGRYARRFMIADKRWADRGLTVFQINLAAGPDQDTVCIDLLSANQIRIQSQGALILKGNPVTINGRRVMPYGNKPI